MPKHTTIVFQRFSDYASAAAGKDLACIGFAGWVATPYQPFQEDELRALMVLGASLWSGGIERKTVANDSR